MQIGRNRLCSALEEGTGTGGRRRRKCGHEETGVGEPERRIRSKGFVLNHRLVERVRFLLSG